LYRLEWALLAESPALRAGSYQYRPSLGGRLSAIALALAICALIVLTLIRMGLIESGSGESGPKLTSVTFRSQSAEHEEQRKTTRTVQRHERKAVVRQQVTPQVEPKPAPKTPLPWIQLSREEFAATDISKMARHPAEASNDSSAGTGAAYGPGEGPGGARLYRAEWYREPSDAEMATYLPHRDISGGWAEIACKTIEHFHVEDCRELGESPPGSGLSRALRQAAWQFLVRPPRIDGKPLIGGWVRIHFDFTAPRDRAGSDAPDAAGG
jgi:protein TonB